MVARGSGVVAATSTGARGRRQVTASSYARCATTATATRCCSWSTRRVQGACHTGERSCFFRSPSDRSCTRRSVSHKFDSGGRRKFHELASDRLVVPVWRELMADTITPVGAFTQVVG